MSWQKGFLNEGLFLLQKDDFNEVLNITSNSLLLKSSFPGLAFKKPVYLFIFVCIVDSFILIFYQVKNPDKIITTI